nr:(E,E)-germacrene B synthase-like [Nicotiana tomentosiformis]
MAQVSAALRQPIHMNAERWEARKYMSIYENIEGHNNLLLRFAKLDFHAKGSTKRALWWKDVDIVNKYPHVRDTMEFHNPAYYVGTLRVLEFQYNMLEVYTEELYNLTYYTGTFCVSAKQWLLFNNFINFGYFSTTSPKNG